MAISLSALLRGANRAGTAYLSGQTRGTLTRQQREARDAEAEREAMDQALARSLDRQRLGLATERERREAREGAAREKREAEEAVSRAGLREAEAAYYRRRPGGGSRRTGLTDAQRLALQQRELRDVPEASALGTPVRPGARQRVARERAAEVERGLTAGAGPVRAPSSATNPADLWEELVDGGMSEADATAEVTRRFPQR